MAETTRSAYARIGLLGNPSDGYGGRVLGFAIADFAARVTVRDASPPSLDVDDGEVTADSFVTLLPRVRRLGGGANLLLAALKKLDDHARAIADAPSTRPLDSSLTLCFESDVPRQVGMAGSSAIVIAALRAAAEHLSIPVTPFALAELALAAETEELGIAAGPQDRVLQAYEGFLAMDFRAPRTEASYRRLDPATLPPLYLAYDPRPGESSGLVHDDVRARFERGDGDVVRAIARFAELADEGLVCLEQGDVHGLMHRVDESFDTRASIWTVRDVDRALVDTGRGSGAACKFTGSGGAVVGVFESESDYPRIEAAYGRAGFRIIRPTIKQPEAGAE